MCEIEGCGKPKTYSRWCQKHYMRWYRHGDPVLHMPSMRVGCVTIGCRTTVGLISKTGLCKRHYDRLRAWGGTPRFPKRKPVAYHSMHYRVWKEYGPASAQTCTLCGDQAGHWAYSHLDDSEVQSEWGPYSYEPWFYVPLCVPCHKRFDFHRACNSGKGAT